MTFNGLAPSEDVVHSICSFVTQEDDALLASLTVRETLRYAAGLRLPKWMSKTQKMERAEEVLLKMGLKDCADNLIGSDLIKGISGGEKRRVTITVQILTEPRVLLLDEPLVCESFTPPGISLTFPVWSRCIHRVVHYGKYHYLVTYGMLNGILC
jgi:ABC-type multidrug transport system ATPase subunit